MKKNEASLLSRKVDNALPKNIATIKPGEIRSVANMLSTIEVKLTPRQLKAIKEIGTAIGNVGLSLDDACLRSLITKEELDNLILYVPEVKDFLRLQQVEYKHKLLNIISNQAVQNGDVKMAMWLLEKQFSEEYDSSIKKDIQRQGRGEDGDIMEMALTFVRRDNANSVPINDQAGNGRAHEIVKIYEIDEVIKK